MENAIQWASAIYQKAFLCVNDKISSVLKLFALIFLLNIIYNIVVLNLFDLYGLVAIFMNILLNIVISLATIRYVLIIASDKKEMDFDTFLKEDLLKDLSNFEKIVAYILLSAIYLLSVVIGLFLLVLPGIFITIKFALALFIFLDENLKPIDALKKSYEYTEGNFLNLFALLISVALLSALLYYILKIFNNFSLIRASLDSLIAIVFALLFAIAYYEIKKQKNEQNLPNLE